MYILFCRLICDALLSSDKLSYQNSESWSLTLKLVRRIIGGVDYKVRLVIEFILCVSGFYSKLSATRLYFLCLSVSVTDFGIVKIV